MSVSVPLDLSSSRQSWVDIIWRVMIMVIVFNATFNNISAISWWSVLLMEETRMPGENYQPATSHWQFYHIMLYRIHLTWVGFEFITSVVIVTDCTGSYTTNYHTITPITTPSKVMNVIFFVIYLKLVGFHNCLFTSRIDFTCYY